MLHPRSQHNLKHFLSTRPVDSEWRVKFHTEAENADWCDFGKTPTHFCSFLLKCHHWLPEVWEDSRTVGYWSTWRISSCVVIWREPSRRALRHLVFSFHSGYRKVWDGGKQTVEAVKDLNVATYTVAIALSRVNGYPLYTGQYRTKWNHISNCNLWLVLVCFLYSPYLPPRDTVTIVTRPFM